MFTAFLLHCRHILNKQTHFLPSLPGWRQQAEGAPEWPGGEVEDHRRSKHEERRAHRRAPEVAGRDGAGERHPAGGNPQPRGGTPRTEQTQTGGPERGAEVSKRLTNRVNQWWSNHEQCLLTLCVIFRAEQLEKEVAVLKEKIHHLDDMLKSQQRKVRHMIEQVRRTCVRLYRANTLSPCSYLCRIYSLFDCVFARSIAPELPHGDPGEGPRDQRAGGESGLLGGWGENCLLSSPMKSVLWHFSGRKIEGPGLSGNEGEKKRPDLCKERRYERRSLFGGHNFLLLVLCELTPDLLCVQNREMHDQMDYFLGGQRSNSYLSSERNPQIVYR